MEVRSSLGVTIAVLVTAFFFLPAFQYSFGGTAEQIAVRRSLSCPLIGFGGVLVSWGRWAGYEWSWTCQNPFRVATPNPPHTNATALGSNRMTCSVEYYTVVGQERISVQNETTYTSSTVFTSSSISAFTTMATNYQSVGYVTATTISVPPAAWETVTCTYG